MGKDAEGNEIVEVTEDNAAEIARKELELEAQETETPEEKAERVTKKQEDKPKEEEKPEEKPEEKEEKPEEKEEKPVELTPEQKEAEQAERKRLLETDDKDLKPEEIENKKIVLLQKETEEKEAFEVRVNDYAKEKDMPVEDARSTLESINKIATKYEKDPEKIAEANLGLQRLVSQKDEEIKAVREESNQPRRPQSAREWEHLIKEQGLTTTQGKPRSWEEVVETYREDNQETTENLEDEQVLKLVAKEIHTRTEVYLEKQRMDAKTKAEEKRGKLISSLSEDDKEYANDVKTLLKTIPDVTVLRDDFSIEHSINWARGKHLTPDKVATLLKEAELSGFKRGQASGKIVTGVIGVGKTPKGKGTVTATPKIINEAWNMFPDAKTQEEAVEMYLDVEKSRKNNKE